MINIDDAGPESGGNFLEKLGRRVRLRADPRRKHPDLPARSSHCEPRRPSYKLGRRVFYRVEAIKSWLD